MKNVSNFELIKINKIQKKNNMIYMIADNRRKFCDCLPSYGNTLLRLPEIICNPVIVIADDRRR